MQTIIGKAFGRRELNALRQGALRKGGQARQFRWVTEQASGETIGERRAEAASRMVVIERIGEAAFQFAGEQKRRQRIFIQARQRLLQWYKQKRRAPMVAHVAI